MALGALWYELICVATLALWVGIPVEKRRGFLVRSGFWITAASPFLILAGVMLRSLLGRGFAGITVGRAVGYRY